MSDINIDYDFYANTYGGGVSAEEFASGIVSASAVIDSLLYPWRAAMLDQTGIAAYRTAVCMQLDFMSGQGTVERIKSERLGDRSVTYELQDAGSTGGLYVHGSAVSPNAAAVLGAAGCLCRWL